MIPSAQDGLEQLKLEGDRTMYPLTRIRFLRFAAAGALVALTATSTPARADELAQNLGPVGPHEPILTTVGSKRVIAFYVPDGGHCAVNAVVWDSTDADADSAARVRVSLSPRQMVHIDSVENKSLNLQCGDHAETLAIVDTSERLAFGATD
jgi:hypothetical protein